MADPPAASNVVKDVPDGRGGTLPEVSLDTVARMVAFEQWEMDQVRSEYFLPSFQDFVDPAERARATLKLEEARIRFAEYAAKLPKAELELWQGALEDYKAQKDRIMSSVEHSSSEMHRVGARLDSFANRVIAWNTRMKREFLPTAIDQRRRVESATTGSILSCDKPSFFDSRGMLVLLLALNLGFSVFLCITIAVSA